MKRIALVALALSVIAPAAHGEAPQVLAAKAEKSGKTWRIHVTLTHPDTGWDHYADGWEVTDAEGNRLGYRTLHHPHESEQPFTRSLTGLSLPGGTREIFIRARCTRDDWSGEPVRVQLQP